MHNESGDIVPNFWRRAMKTLALLILVCSIIAIVVFSKLTTNTNDSLTKSIYAWGAVYSVFATISSSILYIIAAQKEIFDSAIKYGHSLLL